MIMTSKTSNVVRLPPLPTIRDILRLYNLNAIRKLSQNFLLDENLNNKIVKCAGKLQGTEICEIGPGPGNITRSILTKGAEKVFLIEKDPRFLPTLQMLQEAAYPGIVNIILGDVMSFNMQNLFSVSKCKNWADDYPDIQIIGNLPFNVSTALIIKYLQNISERKNAWSYGRVRMTLTFQKEVAERMEASVMTTQRCRLSVMCQNWCEIDLKFVIPGKAFLPKPKVDVGVVHFRPRVEPIIPLPFALVEKVVTSVHRFRQKHVIKGLRTLFPESCADTLVKEMIEKSQVDPTCRPFQLSVSEIGNLCWAYKDILNKSPEFFKYSYLYKDEDWEIKEREENEKLLHWKNKIDKCDFY